MARQRAPAGAAHTVSTIIAAMAAPRFIAALLLALLSGLTLAQAYPSRPIRMVVDTSPGGLTDLLGRLAADGLAQKFAQTVVVDNKPGGSGNVAIDFVVRAPADG